MSRLLDEALILDDPGRRSWLDKLPTEYGDVVEALRHALLSEFTGPDPRLATLPKLSAEEEPDMQRRPGLHSGDRLGPYELVRPLGAGGMAVVWLARRADGTFTREVALKLPLTSRLRTDLEQRFVREREILASLNHPNIARLLDAGFARDGQPYIALEYVAGVPLTKYCDERRLPLAERLRLFRQVLGAVHYAHAHLVVHRDLKPSNILVSEDGQVHLLDFGIAKLLSDGIAQETELTQLSGRALTLDYAAPEQLTGSAVTTAADVYALGVMLYELLTGVRPYQLRRDSPAALEEAILRTEPVLPSRVHLSEAVALERTSSTQKLARALRGDLDTIVAKALKKSATDRYATAIEFSEDIGRFLAGEVVLARPDHISYRLLKFTRRHWLGISVVGALMLTLAAGLAATSYEAHSASAQRDATLQVQWRLLTSMSAARLRENDIPGAMRIVLEVLPHRGSHRAYTPEALDVFQRARASDAQLAMLSGHTGYVEFATFSPDGRLVVTASDDKTVRIWDAVTGREVKRLSGHALRVNFASFSPDGRQIVTASADRTARVWDVATGREIMTLTGHAAVVNSAAFSPDGTRVVTAGGDQTARIWETSTGRLILTLIGHAGRVDSAEFSPDGKRVVTASGDKTGRIWDATTGRQLVKLIGHTERVMSTVFAADGSRVITGSMDQTARIWDAASGRELLRLTGHSDRVSCADFAPDGRRVVTSSLDGTARIWDVESGRQLSVLSGHTLSLLCARYAQSGDRIVTSSMDKTARIWDARLGHELITLSGHTDRVVTASFSPDGSRIVTGSYDKSVRVWDAVTGRQLLLLNGHENLVSCTSFSPDGRRILSSSVDHTARIWDSATGQPMLLLNGNAGAVWCAAFSADGGQVATASDDGVTRIWNAETGTLVHTLTRHTDMVGSAVFSGDGSRALTGSADKTARIWDIATDRQLLVLSGHTNPVTWAAFSPDDARVVTGSADKTARTWDSMTGRPLVTFSGHTDIVGSALFSSDGLRIVTGSFDKTARIWEAATGRQLLLLAGHTNLVESAKFSADDRFVVTASDDKTARIWSARVEPLETQIAWAHAAQFEPPSNPEELGVATASAPELHRWAGAADSCDEAAGAPYDPDRRAPGVMLEQLVADVALRACSARAGPEDSGRHAYESGRAAMAGSDFATARKHFERALASGYRAAYLDLAALLLEPRAAMLDTSRALFLYEQAWKRGVTAAAFQLGLVYERGVRTPGSSTDILVPDRARAWRWYQQGADAGEPNALARFASQYDTTGEFSQRADHLIQAFKFYAAAAERAEQEDWPDDAWKDWRYRRATLARLLAREGLMQKVAGVYDNVCEQYAARPTIWRRLAAMLGIEAVRQ